MMDSACVVFGMERLLLSLLAQIGEPEALLNRLREVLNDQGTSEPQRECEHAALV